jgi:cbb3-type cytochrome oxidase subunit 3
MDKKSLHHLWTIIRPIKAWYLLVLFLVSIGITVAALRQNNLGMVELRREVYLADEQNKDVEGALQRLRAYVHSHMNTDLSSGGNAVYPPIQLKYTYQRLKQAEQDRIKQASSQVYTAAQEYCERLHPTGFSGSGRIPCIEQYVSEHKVAGNTIPDAMYKFDFVSPTWSPDLAGFGLLASILLAVLLVLRIAAGRLLKVLTK